MLLKQRKPNPKIALKPQSLQKVDSEIAAIEQTISTKEAELAKAQAETEVVREQCRSNEGFEEYESQRDNGIDLSKLEYEEMRRLRADANHLFQDPYTTSIRV